MVIHKDAAKFEAWDRMKETNPILRSLSSLREAYDQSENPIVSSLRSVTSTIGSWFDENETAQVTRILRYMDPTFQMDAFQRELREYIVPEVVDAYLSADREALQMWCSEAVSTYLAFIATLEFYEVGCRRIMSFGRLWNNISNKDSLATAKSSTSGTLR